MADINVDQEQLSQFIDSLTSFWKLTQEDWNHLEVATGKAAQSWQGISRLQFSDEYDKMKSSVIEAIGSIDNALHWLGNFKEIIDEIERGQL